MSNHIGLQDLRSEFSDIRIAGHVGSSTAGGTTGGGALSKGQIEARKERPGIPTVLFRNIPERLRDLSQWILWEYVRSKDGRWTKVPKYVDTNVAAFSMEKASSTNPETWTNLNAAGSQYWLLFAFNRPKNTQHGLGLCLQPPADGSAGITVIDLDDARNRDTHELTPLAAEMVARFNSYAEVSPSGTGLKIYISATKPGPRCKGRTHPGIEIFDQKRFVAVTGLAVPGTPLTVEDRQEELDALYWEMFPNQPPTAKAASSTPTAPAHVPVDPNDPRGHAPLPVVDLSDKEIIDLAGRARNGAKFQSLWNGSWAGYDSRSTADFALAGMLAFYCGPDPSRIERLMRQSGLRREKWGRTDYLPRTIANAIAGKTDFYGSSLPDTWELPADLRAEIGPPLAEPFVIICGPRKGTPSTPTGVDGASEVPYTVTTEKMNPALAAAIAMSLATADLTAENLDYFARQRDADREARNETAGTQETMAARLIKQVRYENQSTCPSLRSVLLTANDGTHDRVKLTPCDRLDCPSCRATAMERFSIWFGLRLGGALGPKVVWTFTCDPNAWEKIRRRLTNAGGNYFRCNVSGQVWTDQQPPPDVLNRAGLSATEMPAAAAITQLIAAAESVPHGWSGKHPFSSSRAWRMPRDETAKNDTYTVVGRGPSGRDAVNTTKRIIEDADLGWTARGPRSLWDHCIADIHIPIPSWWGEERRRKLHQNIMRGESIYDCKAAGDGASATDKDGFSQWGRDDLESGTRVMFEREAATPSSMANAP